MFESRAENAVNLTVTCIQPFGLGYLFNFSFKVSLNKLGKGYISQNLRFVVGVPFQCVFYFI